MVVTRWTYQIKKQIESIYTRYTKRSLKTITISVTYHYHGFSHHATAHWQCLRRQLTKIATTNCRDREAHVGKFVRKLYRKMLWPHSSTKIVGLERKKQLNIAPLITEDAWRVGGRLQPLHCSAGSKPATVRRWKTVGGCSWRVQLGIGKTSGRERIFLTIGKRKEMARTVTKLLHVRPVIRVE